MYLSLTKSAKKLIVLILVCGAFVVDTYGQEFSLFNQTITNSFIYNPALAGLRNGSISLSHRRMMSNIPGAPSSSMLSIHGPVGRDQLGIGVNIVHEEVNVFQEIHFMGALAYHLKLNEHIGASFGLSGEYFNMDINDTKVQVLDEDDFLIQNFGFNTFDFSFGMNIYIRQVDIGFAMNRMMNWLEEDPGQLTEFFNGYIRTLVLVSDKNDYIEPIVMLRKTRNGNLQVDAGAYYHFRDVLVLGGNYRFDANFGATVGIQPNDRLLLAYTHEMFSQSPQSNINPTSEITIRYDIADVTRIASNKNRMGCPPLPYGARQSQNFFKEIFSFDRTPRAKKKKDRRSDLTKYNRERQLKKLEERDKKKNKNKN